MHEPGFEALDTPVVKSEPKGVSIADDESGKLLDQEEWTVIHRGRPRTLHLRVGRGFLHRPRDEMLGPPYFASDKPGVEHTYVTEEGVWVILEDRCVLKPW